MKTNVSLAEQVGLAERQRFFQQDDNKFHLWMGLVGQRLNTKKIAYWYDYSDSPTVLNNSIHSFPADLDDLLKQVWHSKQGAILELNKHQYALICPAVWEGQTLALIYAEVNSQDSKQLSDFLFELQWSTAWLTAFEFDKKLQQQRAELFKNQSVLSLFAEIFAENDASLSLQAFVAKLSMLLNVDRAYLGFLEKNTIDIKFISGMEIPKNKTEWISDIATVMHEALDQNNLVYAPKISHLISVLHEKVRLKKHITSIATCIVRDHQQKPLGAITIERDSGDELVDKEIRLLEAVGLVLGPALEMQRKVSLSLWSLWRERVRRHTKSWWQNRILQGWSALILVIIISLNVIHIPYRLSGDAVVEAAQTQTISAPFDGFIKTINAVPGDVVEQGTAVINLDDRELLLEQVRWGAEINKLNTTYQQAVALFDRTKQREISAELNVANTELQLIESKINRAIITAPFDALVIDGDLRQRIGDVVSQGEPLISIAPANRFQIRVEIEERKIEEIMNGTNGTLYLNAFPNIDWPIEVIRIIPNSQYKDGKAYFIVEASMNTDASMLRPGLRGIVKLSVEERSIMTILTQDMIAWFRQMIWAVWG